jgi:hypothetical protein
MTTETPPGWILLEAAERGNIGDEPIEYLRKIYRHGGTFRALCDTIAKHEKTPVDRKLLCAREAVGWGTPWATTETIGVRAIKLYEEGFGK